MRAGEPIGTRWTPAIKAEIKRSRVGVTRQLVVRRRSLLLLLLLWELVSRGPSTLHLHGVKEHCLDRLCRRPSTQRRRRSGQRSSSAPLLSVGPQASCVLPHRGLPAWLPCPGRLCPASKQLRPDTLDLHLSMHCPFTGRPPFVDPNSLTPETPCARCARLLRSERERDLQRGQQQRARLPGRGLPRLGGRGAESQSRPHRHPAHRWLAPPPCMRHCFPRVANTLLHAFCCTGAAGWCSAARTALQGVRGSLGSWAVGHVLQEEAQPETESS